MVDRLQVAGPRGRLDVEVGGPEDGLAVVFHTGTRLADPGSRQVVLLHKRPVA
jgi:hypothetical protein